MTKSQNGVCMDIVDTVIEKKSYTCSSLLFFAYFKMNYTRLLWSKLYECKRNDPDYAAVIGISFFIPTIVLVFYISALFKGKFYKMNSEFCCKLLFVFV